MYNGFGFVTVNLWKKLEYSPFPRWSGTDVIKFITASDGQLTSEFITVTINVINDSPVCKDYETTAVKGASMNLDILSLAQCTDANGVSLSSIEQS